MNYDAYKHSGTLFNHVLVSSKSSENSKLIDSGVLGIKLTEGNGIDLSKVSTNLVVYTNEKTNRKMMVSYQAMTSFKDSQIRDLPGTIMYNDFDVDSLVAGAILELRSGGSTSKIDRGTVDAIQMLNQENPKTPNPETLTEKFLSFLEKIVADKDIPLQDKICITKGLLLWGYLTIEQQQAFLSDCTGEQVVLVPETSESIDFEVPEPVETASETNN